jgi:outer membrane protein OmpA-like peptidoglycan-associated protein
MPTGHSGCLNEPADDRKDLGASGCGLIGWNVTACVLQWTYNQQSAQLQAVQAQVEAQRGQIAKVQAANRWVVEGDLLFPEGGYQLGPDSEAILSQYAAQSRSLQNTVVAYFRSQGVNPNVLSANAFGETRPIAPNDAPQSRAQNRRIEIVLEGPAPKGH